MPPILNALEPSTGSGEAIIKSLLGNCIKTGIKVILRIAGSAMQIIMQQISRQCEIVPVFTDKKTKKKWRKGEGCGTSKIKKKKVYAAKKGERRISIMPGKEYENGELLIPT